MIYPGESGQYYTYGVKMVLKILPKDHFSYNCRLSHLTVIICFLSLQNVSTKSKIQC